MFLFRLCRWPRLHFPSLAYGSTTFAAKLIHSIFSFYYVKVFLIHYKVSDYWFNVAQVVFMIWNAINDPLFGYIQDNSTSSIFRIRRKSILYGAPLFVVSFLTFWFPWISISSPTDESSSSSSSSFSLSSFAPTTLAGLHLVFSLCFYDALFTFVLLAQCALFAEMSTNHEDRLRLVLYDQVASLVGSTSVGLCEFSSSSLRDFPAFQLTVVCVSFAAWLGFSFTGKFAKTEIAQMKSKDKELPEIKNDICGLSPNSSSSSSSSSPSSSFWQQTMEILRQRNFLAFVFMNFLQIFHTVFHANFVSIFLDVLFPSSTTSGSDSSYSFPPLAPSTRSFFNGSLFVLPQVLVLCLGPWLRSKGAFWMVMKSFYAKIATAAVLGFLVNTSILPKSQLGAVLLFFLACDSACGNAVFATFNLLVSDVIDEDMKLNKRTSPLSSSVFGTNALITKPAISLAPMLVIFALNPFGFEAFKMDPAGFMGGGGAAQLEPLQWASLTMIWAWPFFVGVLQIVVFSFYTLRNTHQDMVARHVES